MQFAHKGHLNTLKLYTGSRELTIGSPPPHPPPPTQYQIWILINGEIERGGVGEGGAVLP
jgi:hypothetical protein